MTQLVKEAFATSQTLNRLGYALMVNSWALHSHQERERGPTLAAA